MILIEPENHFILRSSVWALHTLCSVHSIKTTANSKNIYWVCDY